MTDAEVASPRHKCPFCRMPTDFRFVGIFMCAICRDQFYDFLWASGVQGAVVVVFQLGGVVFLVEEVLLFVVLVLVKHRLPPPWGRPNHA